MFTHALNVKLYGLVVEYYDLKSAEEAGGDIITMTPQFIRKLKLFGKNPSEYSLETVKGFLMMLKKQDIKFNFINDNY